MKRFLLMLTLCALPLVLTLGTATAYYYFCIHPRLSGDLGRLGAIPFGMEYSDSLNIPRLAENWVDEYTTDLAPRDTVCITIGDSFSQQGQLGYQNFMAHTLGQRIININSVAQSAQTAISLLNSGFFDSLRPRTVIVEIVERNLPKLLTNIDFESNQTITQLLPYQSEDGERLTTSALVKYTYNWLALQLRQSSVCEAQLDTPLFSLQPQKLYFYRSDLDTPECNDEELDAMQKSLDRLQKMFAQHGIRFLLVVAADKYDLYQTRIAKNPHAAKTLLDQLSSACDTTQLISSKRLFLPLLNQDVRDIYYANDSHWTQTGAEIVGTHLARICLIPEQIEDK